jgi:predicted metal-dependent hydrolase
MTRALERLVCSLSVLVDGGNAQNAWTCARSGDVANATRVRLNRSTGGDGLEQALRAALKREQGLEVSGLNTPVQVRRHPAARRLTLRVSQVRREVVLTIPTGGSLAEAGKFVGQHMDWVRQRLEALPSRVDLANGSRILYRGEPHLIEMLGPTRHKSVAWSEGTRAARQALKDLVEAATPSRKARVVLPDKLLPKLCVSGQIEHAPRRLRDWLIKEAHEELTKRVAVHSSNLGLKASRVSVRDQTSRWGSCSSARVLSFSWRLILAPTFVLDYVAAHEVAHLKEMNHGPRFWALVRKTNPRMEEARRWLKKHGAELHRYELPG